MTEEKVQTAGSERGLSYAGWLPGRHPWVRWFFIGCLLPWAFWGVDRWVLARMVPVTPGAGMETYYKLKVLMYGMLFLVLPVVVLAMAWVADQQIKRSEGRFRGRLMLRVPIVVSLLTIGYAMWVILDFLSWAGPS